MELYNFFSLPIVDKDKVDKIAATIKENCEPHFIQVVEHTVKGMRLKENNIVEDFHNTRYSIIGQLYGEDTNIGDVDLLTAMGDLPYVYFDAFCPLDNNISE